jgi:acyl-CoA synthetase (AMP-forming)/AMP-acid ligase II
MRARSANLPRVGAGRAAELIGGSALAPARALIGGAARLPDPALLRGAARAPARALRELANVAVLARAGIVAPMRPDKLPRLALAAIAYGPSLAAALAAGAIRHPERAVVDDEQGRLSYAEADARTDAIACGLRELGLRPGDVLAVMARNHRGFVEAAVAAAKLGADVLALNTAFSGPQLAEICRREKPRALIYDGEFAELLRQAGRGRVRVAADAAQAGGLRAHSSLAELALARSGERPPAPGRAGRVTILTSGTTGAPKGASRGASAAGGRLPSLDAPAGLLARIPLKAGMRIGVAAPMFHTWGLANLALGLGLAATLVTLRRFEPEAWLARIEDARVQALIVVPVMMQRILALEQQVRSRFDTSSLEVVAASGSALPGDLAARWMDAFGDTLYNVYGSTEVAMATIATPQDMRAAPGTAGRPARGVRVKLLDERGREVPRGRAGRIFVASSAVFEGYTGGGDKQRIGAFVATGDVGRFDAQGRLFVEGRDDEMIVSGGENVFPGEVEDVLARHPAVAEAAAIGVPDEEFGQRLRAFVALREGQSASEEELKAWVRERLARFKVPREVRFLERLPRNATGKVLKRELDAG